MRLVRFHGAISLDGYIAGPNGEFDWIPPDPEFNFAEMWAGADTFLIGRKTWDAMRQMGNTKPMKGIEYVVFSRTLKPRDCPEATLIRDGVAFVTDLRNDRGPDEAGKDVILFGGGELFRSLVEAGLVDRVEVGLVPVLLGGGIPLLPSPASRTKLQLRKQRVYEKTGSILLEYEILRA